MTRAPRDYVLLGMVLMLSYLVGNNTRRIHALEQRIDALERK